MGDCEGTRRDTLEAAAASVLGYMLLEFSRLETDLGLLLAWAGNGANLESLSNTVEKLSFRDKLLRLKGLVQSVLPLGSEARASYERWIDSANTFREHRNCLVHGRWGVDTHRNCVTNVMGLPTSPTQVATQYSIEQLMEAKDGLKDLRRELSDVRTRWPL